MRLFCCCTMKPSYLLYIVLLFGPLLGIGQTLPVASGADKIGKTPVEKLAAELTANLSSDRDKVTAIFHWITANIDYKVASRLNATPAFRRRMPVEAEDTSEILKPLDERVAELVLEKREAVCDGYARLFKTLCAYAGIKAEVISGYARTNAGRMGRSFRSNHSWNAVQIDSTWYLLDATWAAGYVSYFGDAFIRSYDSRYFLAPPAQFILDHYPEDPSWALLPELPVLAEFSMAPFRLSGFVRNKISGFQPAKGTVEAAVGDTILIEVETEDAEKKLEVWDQPFGDPRLHTSPIWLNYPERPAQVNGRKVSYAYTVTSPFVQWLYVVYNGDCILQYRLKVRPSLVQSGGNNGVK